MRQSGILNNQLQEVTTIHNLTAALEGVSSIRISQVKDRVLPGRECFDELWQTYARLRIGGVAKHGRFDLRRLGLPARHAPAPAPKTARPLNIVITSEGNLGGSIDDQIIGYFLEKTKADKSDILALGSHGASLLRQRGRPPVATHKLPEQLSQAVYQQIGKLIQGYDQITVYYQSYVSLGQQTVRQLNLLEAVTSLADKVDNQEEISEQYYLFEPSLSEIIATMETVMLQIALREVILDSQLAQLASRFTAMAAAEERAQQQQRLLRTAWRKALRDESDRQQRELTAGSML